MIARTLSARDERSPRRTRRGRSCYRWYRVRATRLPHTDNVTTATKAQHHAARERLVCIGDDFTSCGAAAHAADEGGWASLPAAPPSQCDSQERQLEAVVAAAVAGSVAVVGVVGAGGDAGAAADVPDRPDSEFNRKISATSSWARL